MCSHIVDQNANGLTRLAELLVEEHEILTGGLLVEEADELFDSVKKNKGFFLQTARKLFGQRLEQALLACAKKARSICWWLYEEEIDISDEDNIEILQKELFALKAATRAITEIAATDYPDIYDITCKLAASTTYYIGRVKMKIHRELHPEKYAAKKHNNEIDRERDFFIFREHRCANRTFKDIGNELGISASRAARLFKRVQTEVDFLESQAQHVHPLYLIDFQ